MLHFFVIFSGKELLYSAGNAFKRWLIWFKRISNQFLLVAFFWSKENCYLAKIIDTSTNTSTLGLPPGKAPTSTASRAGGLLAPPQYVP